MIMSYFSVCLYSTRNTCFLGIPPHSHSNPRVTQYITSSIPISLLLGPTETLPLYTQQLTVSSSATSSISSISLRKVFAMTESCFCSRDITIPSALSNNDTFLSNTSYTKDPRWGHPILNSRSFHKQIPSKLMESDFFTYSSILV